MRRSPELHDFMATIPPNETYRRWLAIVDWRLHASAQSALGEPLPNGLYGSSDELVEDVRVIQRSLSRRTTTCWCRVRSSAGPIRSRRLDCIWPDWMCGRTLVTTKR